MAVTSHKSQVKMGTLTATSILVMRARQQCGQCKWLVELSLPVIVNAKSLLKAQAIAKLES